MTHYDVGFFVIKKKKVANKCIFAKSKRRALCKYLENMINVVAYFPFALYKIKMYDTLMFTWVIKKKAHLPSHGEY